MATTWIREPAIKQWSGLLHAMVYLFMVVVNIFMIHYGEIHNLTLTGSGGGWFIYNYQVEYFDMSINAEKAHYVLCLPINIY